MSEKQALEDIKILAESIKRNLSNKGQVSTLASTLIKLAKKYLDEELSKEIVTQAVNIINAMSLDEIMKAASTIISLCLTDENNKPVTFINPLETIRKKRYDKKKKKYGEDAVNEKETQIITVPNYVENLHGVIKNGKWEGYLHAHLTDNLRMMYLWDRNKRILTYVDIITKNELDKS